MRRENQSMAWMKTDYSKDTDALSTEDKWWSRLGALEIMGEMVPLTHCSS